jgi:uroporphyrinogen-III decarboxylase
MANIDENGFEPGDRLAEMDLAAHNAEQAEAWAAFNAGKPVRTPIVFGTNTRYFMRAPRANPEGLDFRRYTEDPDVMFHALLGYARWSRFNLLQDQQLGLPDRWSVSPDFQNYYEAAWFGCPVEYRDGQVPDATPAYADAPERLLDRGLPDPSGGLMARAEAYCERFRELAKQGPFLGREIEVGLPGPCFGTDGPMTVACNLFGPGFVCAAMAAEPNRLHRLLEFITDATILRMETWRRRYETPFPQDGFGCADDSIALISTAMYREHILPYHRRIYDTFGTPQGRSIHLCGNSTRHFRTIHEELGVVAFDTGFPVDFGRLRRELGPDIKLLGGPHVGLLQSSTPAEVYVETRRIMQSGVLEGGLFVLREGNNLAPETPLDNTEAMYRAGREFGKFAA